MLNQIVSNVSMMAQAGLGIVYATVAILAVMVFRN